MELNCHRMLCVQGDVDVSQPAVVEHGCHLGLIVTFIGLYGYDDVSRFLPTALGIHMPVELGGLGNANKITLSLSETKIDLTLDLDGLVYAQFLFIGRKDERNEQRDLLKLVLATLLTAAALKMALASESRTSDNSCLNTYLILCSRLQSRICVSGVC